jgi:hypothetical protein
MNLVEAVRLARFHARAKHPPRAEKDYEQDRE